MIKCARMFVSPTACCMHVHNSRQKSAWCGDGSILEKGTCSPVTSRRVHTSSAHPPHVHPPQHRTPPITMARLSNLSPRHTHLFMWKKFCEFGYIIAEVGLQLLIWKILLK